MMGKIEKLLNFTSEYYEVGEYGQLYQENGTWSGLIRELLDKRKNDNLHLTSLYV